MVYVLLLFHAVISLAFTYLLSRSTLQLSLENDCNVAVIKSLKLTEYQSCLRIKRAEFLIHRDQQRVDFTFRKPKNYNSLLLAK
jgi:hypothetical protein